MWAQTLRELVLSLSSIVGLFAGFSWALHHQVRVQALSSRACHPHPAGHGAKALGYCIGDDFARILLAWLVPMGVGLLLGALAGLLLVVAVPVARPGGPRRARRRARARAR